jgi:hypothetical protein
MAQQENNVGNKSPEGPFGAEWQSWAKQQGVDLSSEGLVLPDTNTATLDHKIAPDLSTVASRVTDARKRGLDIIYLPGSYDLVHVGHLSYVNQVVASYIEGTAKQGRNLGRPDLYLVMLADDDNLIERIKANKFVGNGGTELFKRPVEAGLDENGRSPRLDALATFPVDCVGFIPSPSAESLPEPYDLNIPLCRKIASSVASGAELDSFMQILDTYEQIEGLFANHESLEGAPWRIAAWQLYVSLQIALPKAEEIKEPSVPFAGKSISRAVSIHDQSYIDAVKMINRWAGMDVMVVDDTEILSTSGLLQKLAPKTLLDHKASAIRSR